MPRARSASRSRTAARRSPRAAWQPPRLKVDFEMALLLVTASGLYRLLAHRMRGYSDAQARQIFRDLGDMPATVEVTDHEIAVSFHRRAHLPPLPASRPFLKSVRIPSWSNRGLPLSTSSAYGPRGRRRMPT